MLIAAREYWKKTYNKFSNINEENRTWHFWYFQAKKAFKKKQKKHYQLRLYIIKMGEERIKYSMHTKLNFLLLSKSPLNGNKIKYQTAILLVCLFNGWCSHFRTAKPSIYLLATITACHHYNIYTHLAASKIPLMCHDCKVNLNWTKRIQKKRTAKPFFELALCFITD